MIRLQGLCTKSRTPTRAWVVTGSARLETSSRSGSRMRPRAASRDRLPCADLELGGDSAGACAFGVNSTASTHAWRRRSERPALTPTRQKREAHTTPDACSDRANRRGGDPQEHSPKATRLTAATGCEPSGVRDSSWRVAASRQRGAQLTLDRVVPVLGLEVLLGLSAGGAAVRVHAGSVP
jgi:cytochrome P450